MKTSWIAALLLPLAAVGCVVTELEEQPDDLYVKGATELSPEQLARYDATTSALAAGTLAESAGRWEAARLAYHAVTGHDPSNLRAIMARTRTLLAEGRVDQAADLLSRTNKPDAPHADLLAATGSVLLASGAPQRAVEHLRKARELQPNGAQTAHQLVAALILSGRHEAAVEELAGTDPADLPDYLLLPVGRAALMAERHDAAAAAFEEAARRDGGSHVPWVELGRAHLLRHDLRAARDALLTALALAPSEPDAFVLLGHVRWLSGDVVRAGRCYQTALLNGAEPKTLGPMLQIVRDQAESPSP